MSTYNVIPILQKEASKFEIVDFKNDIITLLATVDDCNKVADQVHWETIVVAVKPMLTLPPASKAVSRLSASW